MSLAQASGSVDVVRVVEGAVGAVLVTIALVVCVSAVWRRWRARSSAGRVGHGVPALARVGGPLVNPVSFGGGFPAARSVRRHDTVTYGYLAVVEEFVSDDDATHWCTLTVRLPGRVPALVVDHRVAVGRPDVPPSTGWSAETGDVPFDAAYAVRADDRATVERIVTPAVRASLVAQPVQRLALRDNSVVVRTFDGELLTTATTTRLTEIVGQYLASTPSFVTYPRAPVATSGGIDDAPLPRGFYGLDSPTGLA